MKRRLSVAISFIGDPLVVYLDEPSTVGEAGGVWRSAVQGVVISDVAGPCGAAGREPTGAVCLGAPQCQVTLPLGLHPRLVMGTPCRRFRPLLPPPLSSGPGPRLAAESVERCEAGQEGPGHHSDHPQVWRGQGARAVHGDGKVGAVHRAGRSQHHLPNRRSQLSLSHTLSP